MINIRLLLAKRAFMKQRVDVYESLISGVTGEGSRKTELLSDMFDRWYKRDHKRGDSIAMAFAAIRSRLTRGMSLAEALRPFVPVEEALLIEAGETSGKLSDALAAAIKQKDTSDQIRNTLKGALTEPASQMATLLLMSILFGRYIWPDMMRSIPREHWPAWSTPIIDFQIALGTNFLLLASFALLAIAYYASLPRWTGKVRSIIEKIPPYATYRDKVGAALLGILGGLIASGMTIDEALARIARSSSPYLRWHVTLMRKRVPVYGHDSIKALDTGLFSQQVLDKIADAAATRAFDETLVHMSSNALTSIVSAVRKTAMAFNVVLLLAIGAVFMWSTAAQVLGMQQATDAYVAAQTK